MTLPREDLRRNYKPRTGCPFQVDQWIFMSCLTVFADRLPGRFDHRVHAVPFVIRIRWNCWWQCGHLRVIWLGRTGGTSARLRVIMATRNYHIRFLFALCCCVLFSKKRIRVCARGCNVDSMDSMNSTDSAKPKRNEYIDPRGYWIDPSRNIRRLGDKDGEQVAVIRATPSCSDAEWDRFYTAIVACLDATKA
jgi:hypothetical protein